MIRRTHQGLLARGTARFDSASRALVLEQRVSRWAMAGLLFALAGCTVECHSSTSHSTSSSSGGEQSASHDHHHPGHESAQPQNGRGDSVRAVSTGDKPVSGGADSNDQGGRSAGGRHEGHRVVRPSGPAPDNASGSSGSGGSDGSGTSAGTVGGDTIRTTPSPDAGGGEATGSSGSTDSGAVGTPAGGEEPAVGKKPRTPSNKRENEPHVARPTKKRAVMKGEGREGDGSANKGEKHE